jgi:hypothetical protein
MDTFCWIQSTHTIPRRPLLVGTLGHEFPHPGVGPAEAGDERKHHKYYQWVCLVLFLQVAIL